MPINTPDTLLGEDFLTWLWFRSDASPEYFKDKQGEPFEVVLEQRIVVRGGQGQAMETASVSGSLSPLREARFGLGTGKKVSRALLRLEKDGMVFQVGLRADDFCLAGMKTPKIDHADREAEPDAMLLEKIFLLETCVELVDTLYASFLSVRLSADWKNEVEAISQWLQNPQ